MLYVDSAQPGRIDSADGELLELLDEGRFRNGVIHMHHRTSHSPTPATSTITASTIPHSPG